MKEAVLSNIIKESENVEEINVDQDDAEGKEDEQEVVETEKVVAFLKRVKVTEGKL